MSTMNSQNRSKSAKPNTPQKTAPKGTANMQMSRDEVRRAQAMARRKKKRRRQYAFYGILLLIIIFVSVILSLTVFFHIEEITVDGESVYATDDIKSAAGIELDDNMFMINTDKIEKQIEKSLPYVGEAEIVRKLPAMITIKITSTSAAYAFSIDSGYVILDESGKVLQTQVQELPESAAVIYGADLVNAVVGEKIVLADENDFLLVNKLVQNLADAKISNITEIDITDELQITMMYQGRIRLEFGSTAKLEKKIRMAAKALEDQDRNNSSQTGVLDLKNNSGVYFRREDLTQAVIETTTQTSETTTQTPETTIAQ